MPPQTTTTHKIRGSVGRRAELLADRIEEGAAGLAAFVEGLSEAEWLEPVSGTDRRSVGVIVHHVASMYPIEIDVARAIASGKPVTDVTWDVVAELNTKHAREHAEVTKAAALELLRQKVREALPRARLMKNLIAQRLHGFGATVTAQFVIEDHALRHSWHHLARMRKALAR